MDWRKIAPNWFETKLFLMLNSIVKCIRASTADVSNVPNAKYLAHLAHQTQKQSFIRCVKCVKFLQHATVTVLLHFWHHTNSNGICTLLFFYSSFSLIPLWATPSPFLRILLSLLPLCIIALSLVKDEFRCGYILSWALAWVRWRCGSWVWQHGGLRWGRS